MKIGKKTGYRAESSPIKRFEGDKYAYFLLHNMISVISFFLIAFQADLFESQTETLSDIFSSEFVYLVVNLFGISIITGILGRIIAYVALKLIFEKKKRIYMKSFGDMNTGINQAGIRFIIAAFINSVLFAMGAFTIIQSELFQENTLVTLILTYLAIKAGIYFFMALFGEFKL